MTSKYKHVMTFFAVLAVCASLFTACTHRGPAEISNTSNQQEAGESAAKEVLPEEAQESEAKPSITPWPRSEKDLDYDTSKIDQTVMKDKDIKNILLIGQDRRETQSKEQNTRSDTIIICSLDSKHNEIKLTSLMRDLYVQIPDHGSTRINAAYVYGGMELLDQTIEDNFGIQIDANVEVDFEGFLETASMLAPITLELTENEAEYINKELPDEPELKEGKNKLNAKQMLSYVRIRYVGNSDYERTERQRRVLQEIFKKMKEQNLLTLMDLSEQLMPYFATDLSTKEGLGYIYAVFGRRMRLQEETLRIPVDGSYSSENIGGMAVLVPDLEKNKDALRNFIYGESDTATDSQNTSEEKARILEDE